MTRPPLRAITTFGLGHMRPASGTWGSMPSVLLAAAIAAAAAMHTGSLDAVAQTGSAWWWVYHGILAAVILYFGAACIVQGDRAEARWGKDPKETVADETAGQCIPLLFPSAAALSTPANAAFTFILAFLAFRLLDIVKPFPARQIQRVAAGWGILLDDLIAGVYALVLVHVAAAVAF